MEASEQKKSSALTRREMLATLTRYGVLAGVVVSLTVLTRRSGACVIDNPCSRCGQFDSCDLDKARQARREKP